MTASPTPTPTLTASPAASFQILVLGPFAVVRDGVVMDTDRWPRRAQSLLRMLAVAPGQRRLRDEVIDSIWPDASPAAGASNLRYVVFLLRRALAPADPSPVLLKRGWVMLNPAHSWSVDIDRFEALARTAQPDLAMLETAAGLYRGEVLTDDRYEEWARPVRQRTERAWRDLCLRLATGGEQRGAWQEAAQWLERALDQDPLDEEVLRRLLIQLDRLDRRADAIRRYRWFESRLADELGVAPSEATRRLISGLADPEPPPHQVPSPHAATQTRLISIVPRYPLPTPAPFVGRQAEMSQIMTALTDSRSDQPRLILLLAEAGMGKTRLIAEATLLARESGAVTLAGGCYEHAGRLPYGPIHDAFADFLLPQREELLPTYGDALLAELARVVPELGVRSGDLTMGPGSRLEDQRLRLFTALAELLRRIAVSRPVLLALDDLHWADSATLHLVHFLARQSDLDRVLIVGASRHEGVGKEAPVARLGVDLGRSGQARLLFLTALSESDLGRVLDHRLDAQCPVELIADLHARTAGNPFFALEIARLLQQEGRLPRAGDVWRPAPAIRIDLPPAVRETIGRRLLHLEPEWREALTYGAVLGRDFPYAALAAMWDGEQRRLHAALEAGLEAQVLIEIPIGYAFRHPLVREVLYARIATPRRSLLHGRAGLSLERLAGPRVDQHAAELAYHFELAGPEFGTRAIRYLTIAARAATHAYAMSEARTMYERALELAGDDPVAGELHEWSGDIEAGIGRSEAAIEHYNAALAVGPAGDALEVRGRRSLKLARQLTFRRDLDAADDALESALRCLPRDDPERSAIFAVRALGRICRGDYAAARAATNESLRLADASGAPDRMLEALTMIAHPSIAADGPGVSRILQERLPTLQDAGAPVLAAEATMLYVWHRIWVRGIFGADEAVKIAGARDTAGRTGSLATEAMASMFAGAGQWLAGDWLAARQSLLRMLELSAGLDRTPAPQAMYFLGTLLIGHGELVAAEAYLRQGLNQLDSGFWVEPPHGGIWLNQALAEWAVASGDHHGARQALIDADAAARRLGCVTCTCIMSAVAAEVWAAIGEAGQGRAAARRALKLAKPLGRMASRGIAERALAQCATPDQAGEAVTRAARAVGIFRTLHQPYELTRSLRVLGSASAATGDDSAAFAAWTEALSIARRLGAEPERRALELLLTL